MSDEWICDECRIAAVNGDFSGLDYSYDAERADERLIEITAGLGRLGWLVPCWSEDDSDAQIEHSIEPCDCCGDRAHGRRWHFTVLGDPEDERDE